MKTITFEVTEELHKKIKYISTSTTCQEKITPQSKIMLDILRHRVYNVFKVTPQGIRGR